MKVYYDIPNLNEDTAIVIGNFDGVHVAHHKLISRGAEAAQRLGLKLLILTLYPHPSKVIPYDSKLLSTHQQQVDLLMGYNPAYIVFMPFSRELQNIEAQDFFRNTLVGKLKAKSISVGYNYTFGKNRTGTAQSLHKLCEEGGVELLVLDRVAINTQNAKSQRVSSTHMEEEGVDLPVLDRVAINTQNAKSQRISSTHIRKALISGDLALANEMLGRYYALSGKIIYGDGIGKKDLYPTINLEWENELLPKDGIYAGYATVFDSIEPAATETVSETKGNEHAAIYKSAVYIGKRPSIPANATSSEATPLTEQRVEAYLLDFSGDIHGRYVMLHLVQYIRHDIKFDSLKQLKSQITKDISCAEGILAVATPPTTASQVIVGNGNRRQW